MTKLNRFKNEFLFHFISTVSKGYIIDGMIFVDKDFKKWNLLKDRDFHDFDFENTSTIKELLLNSKYPQVLAENYHLENNKHVISKENLYFLVSNGTVNIGKGVNTESYIKEIKEPLDLDYKLYVIENKGELDEIMQYAFSDFIKKDNWFYYNERFQRFISTNALLIK